MPPRVRPTSAGANASTACDAAAAAAIFSAASRASAAAASAEAPLVPQVCAEWAPRHAAQGWLFSFSGSGGGGGGGASGMIWGASFTLSQSEEEEEYPSSVNENQPALAIPRAFFVVDKGGAETLAEEAYRTLPVNEACRCAVGRGDAGLTCDEGLLSGGVTAFGTI